MAHTNAQQGSSSLTINEFPRFISENNKHLRVNLNIPTNVTKIFNKSVLSLKKSSYFKRFI